MNDGKKISELNQTTNLNDACCFPVLSNGATKKITFGSLINCIMNGLEIPKVSEVERLKQELEALEPEVELNEKNIVIIQKAIDEIHKTDDAQDVTIARYISLFDELKAVYEQATISGGVVDSSLNANSINPVQNKVLAKIIPETASDENKLVDNDLLEETAEEIKAMIDEGSALVPSMTQSEYDELSEEEKTNGQIREITDAPETPIPFAVMNDDIATGANVWSASKTSSEIAEVESKIDDKGSPVLLWENQNHTSAVSSGWSVEIPKIANYKMFVAVYKGITSGSITDLAQVMCIPNVNHCVEMSKWLSSDSNNSRIMRVDTTTKKFSCVSAASAVVAIPYQLYGIK